MSGTQLHRDRDWVTETVAELPALATVAEVVAVLRTSRRNVYRMVALGRLHAVKPADGGSSRLLFPRASLEDFLRRMEGIAA